MQQDTRIFLEIEKSKIKREKSKLVLEKSISLYFIFMLIGVIGFVFDYIDSFMLNTLIVLGIIILIAGALPYVLTVSRSEKQIDNYLKK